MKRIVLRFLALLAIVVPTAVAASPAYAVSQSVWSTPPAACDAEAPTVQTNPADPVTGTTARLRGTLESLGSATSANASFEWGTSSGNYTHPTTSQNITAVPANFQEDITGLSRGHTYYYRAVASGDDGEVAYGDESSFYTAEAPTVSTATATGVSRTSAMLHGTLGSPGSASSANVCFEWRVGNTGDYASTANQTSAGGAYQEQLTGLTPGSTYYFHARAFGDNLTSQGSDASFTTGTAPTVSTGAAMSVTATTAVLNGTMSGLGTAPSVSVSFEYRLGATGGFSSTTPEARTATGAFSASLAGLTPNATYQFRARAVGDLTATGDMVNFYTDGTPPSAIADLTVAAASSSTMSLMWTAPGDDGNTGTATLYDIRYLAGTPLSEYYWSSGTQVNGEPVPLSPGNSQTCWVGNLYTGTTYYFGIKTADDVGNWSAISNIVLQTTPPTPTTTTPSGGSSPSSLASTVTTSGFTASGTLTVDAGGIAREAVTLECSGYNSVLHIPVGTRLLDSTGSALTTIGGGGPLALPAPPPKAFIVQSVEFGPAGATFSPAITLTMRYDATSLPAGSNPADLYIAFWNGTQWVTASGAVDTSARTVMAGITHFSQFALMGKLPEAQASASFAVSGLEVTPQSVAPGIEVSVEASVSNNGGGAGRYDATLKINGNTESVKQILLNPGGHAQIRFVVVKQAPGTYTVELGGETGSFTVASPTTPPVTTALSPMPSPSTSTSPVAVVNSTRNSSRGNSASSVQWWLIAIAASGLMIVAALIVLIIRTEKARARNQ